MSACISREGEYGSHKHDESREGRFVCLRCGVMDEPKILIALDAQEAECVRLRAALDDATGQLEDANRTIRALVGVNDPIAGEGSDLDIDGLNVP